MWGLQSEIAAVLGAGPGYDAEELLVLNQGLRRELLGLDVDQVAFERQGAVAKGPKGIEALARGGLVIRCAPSPARLRAVAETTVAWLGRQRMRRATLTLEGDALEVTDVPSEEQSRLVEQWVARHCEADA